MNSETIKQNAVSSFKEDIRVIDGIQWVPVTDAKAAIGFAIVDTMLSKDKEHKNEIASTTEILNMVNETLEQSKIHGLESEVIGYALIRLKENPTLTISQALEAGLQEWDV